MVAACSSGVCGSLNEVALPDGSPGDVFGIAVALSKDGTWLVVGADGRNQGNGSVYVYSCSSAVCDPAPKAAIDPPALPLSAQSQLPQHFGRALSMSEDGSFLIIGAPQECCGESGRYSQGYAYSVACTPGIGCAQPVLLGSGSGLGTYFGDTVAVSGDASFVAIGSYGRGSYGAVYTASCQPGGVCGQLTLFSPSDGASFDQFGEALVLDGDGSLLFVGAPGRASQSGVAYVLQCTHASGACIAEYTLVAADAQPGQRFGGCIGVSSDEALAIGTDVGKLYYTLAPSSPASASRSASATANPTRTPSPPSAPAASEGGGLSPGAAAGVAISVIALAGSLAWLWGWYSGALPSYLLCGVRPRRPVGGLGAPALKYRPLGASVA